MLLQLSTIPSGFRKSVPGIVIFIFVYSMDVFSLLTLLHVPWLLECRVGNISVNYWWLRCLSVDNQLDTLECKFDQISRLFSRKNLLPVKIWTHFEIRCEEFVDWRSLRKFSLISLKLPLNIWISTSFQVLNFLNFRSKNDFHLKSSLNHFVIDESSRRNLQQLRVFLRLNFELFPFQVFENLRELRWDEEKSENLRKILTFKWPS